MMDYGELVAGIVLVVVLVGLTIFMRREARAKDVDRLDVETQERQDAAVVLIIFPTIDYRPDQTNGKDLG